MRAMRKAAIEVSSSDGLITVRSKAEHSIFNAVVAAFASGLFCVIAFRGLLTPALLTGVAILAGGLSFVLATRRRTSELRVSNSEIVSKARMGDGLHPERRVSTADVQWLEYQEDTTGPETANHPGGIYAVLAHRSICVLPYVDNEQAITVIEQIHRTFPELAKKWGGHSPFGRSFLALNLKDG